MHPTNCFPPAITSFLTVICSKFLPQMYVHSACFCWAFSPRPVYPPNRSDPSVMGAPCQSLSVKVLLAPAGSRGLCVRVTGTPPPSLDFRHSPPAPALFRWGPFPMALPTLEGQTRPRPSPWTEEAGEGRH